MLKLLFTFTVMLVLHGCVTQELHSDVVLPQNFKAQTISIKPDIFIVNEPFVQTPGELWGSSIGGLVGAAIAAGATSEEQYVALLKQNKINLKEIAREAFKSQLLKSGSSLKLVSNKADIEVQLQILFYGIHPAGPFSDSVEPMLEVGANVFVNNGQHYMDISESIKFPDDELITPVLMEEYVENPELLKNAYMTLAETISETIIQQLSMLGTSH